ncbi:MAG: PEP-CTERM sorting domain-containing protein [Steroidobacteraceae bacterium]|jgi:hypothetical protein
MQLRRFLAASFLGLIAWGASTGSARAAMVLYNSSGVIQGQQSFVQSFNITTPGTLTVTLSNIPWMDTISGLNCFVSTTTSVLGTSTGPGSESMNVAPGTLYAHWFGDANGAYGLGVYGINISFQPSGPAVPLPGSLILLLSGLGLLLGWQARRGPARVLPADQGTLTAS